MYVICTAVIIIIFALLFRYYNGTIKEYKDHVAVGYERIQDQQGRLISESDLDCMPKAVQDYLNYVGIVGKVMPDHFHIKIKGEMRFDKTKDWAEVNASQVSFLDNNTRLFYIVMKMFCIPINGLHHYENGKASMVGKILDILKIIDNEGEIMNIGETVTYFNDMCIFAPAALIDADIKWEEIDNNTVNAVYTSNDITISAKLFFNDKGELVNFISDDRYAVDANGEYENVRWSTPIYEYREYNGYMLVSKGEVVWHYEDEDFCYIRLNVVEHSYD